MLRQHLMVVAVVGGLFCFVPSTHAAGGALFDEVTKEFGSVPRGTILTHQFTMHNPARAPLHVSSLRTSCNCTTAAIAKDELQPGESTVVVVSIDTRKFSATRTFTVYVMIDRPFIEEARLVMQATSRDDVTLTPGELTYGKTKKGSGAKANVSIDYRGAANWRITGIENENGYLLPQLDEVSRVAGQVVYQLSVKLREDLPVGAWHADVYLKTNDPALPRIRVPLRVEVESALTATPSEVTMGQVKAGGQVERKVVIRGTAPFKILSIEGENERFKISGQSEEARIVHVLKVTMNAGQDAQECTQRFKVVTDLAQEHEVEFVVQAQVVQ